MNTKSAIIALCFFLSWGVAFAEEVGPFTVESVRVYENGCTLIKLPDGTFNANGYVTVSSFATARKEMMAIALTAQVSGKRIWINTIGGQGCWGVNTSINDIWIVN